MVKKLNYKTFKRNKTKNENKLKKNKNRTEIYEESKVHKDYVFDMDNINSFISLSVKLIMADLKEMKLID